MKSKFVKLSYGIVKKLAAAHGQKDRVLSCCLFVIAFGKNAR